MHICFKIEVFFCLVWVSYFRIATQIHVNGTLAHKRLPLNISIWILCASLNRPAIQIWLFTPGQKWQNTPTKRGLWEIRKFQPVFCVQSIFLLVLEKGLLSTWNLSNYGLFLLLCIVMFLRVVCGMPHVTAYRLSNYFQTLNALVCISF